MYLLYEIKYDDKIYCFIERKEYNLTRISQDKENISKLRQKGE
jgi:hypothetical protein